MKRLLIVVGILMIFLVGCGGSGGTGADDPIPSLIVGSIEGPDSITETNSGIYSVTASGDVGIEYQWSCEPPSGGQFQNPAASSTTFVANEVDSDIQVTISVRVNSINCSPVIKLKNVTIGDIPPVIPQDSLLNIAGTWIGDVDFHWEVEGGTINHIDEEIVLILIITESDVVNEFGAPFDWVYDGVTLTLTWPVYFEQYDYGVPFPSCFNMVYYAIHTLTMDCNKYSSAGLIVGDVTGLADSENAGGYSSAWDYRCRERAISGSYVGTMVKQQF